jgi:poly-gamma-glutamate capsule biosynthesis protein CapA/YwtB (metallophosphatase superfamily)
LIITVMDMNIRAVTLFLAGDVMLGRGVDQILPTPGDPALQEATSTDARVYVGLAEAVNGPIPAPVSYGWPWGELPAMLADFGPDVRILNMETAITLAGDFAPGKSYHYRMNPANTGSLVVIRPDVCVLANNHVLDFGTIGLADTLHHLARGRLAAVGAGPNRTAARRPLAVPVRQGRVLVVAAATTCSWVPASWAASDDQPGVALLPDLAPSTAVELAETLRVRRLPGDITVASVHMGDNWGYEVASEQVAFARQLIDCGVDVVHGHSSHHPRPLEIYRGKLILYGCGDLINDYEGVEEYFPWRPDLRVAYLVTLDARTGDLLRLELTPLRARQMRLARAGDEGSRWLREILATSGAGYTLKTGNRGLAVTPSGRR